MKTWKHTLSEIDPNGRTAICGECGPTRINRKGYYRNGKIIWRCIESNRESKRKYDWKRRRIKTKPAEYLLLLSRQGGACAICKNPSNGPKSLAVDHCHITGRIRGLLCSKCNLALGLLDDDVRKLKEATNYLERQRPPEGGLSQGDFRGG